VTRTGRNVAVIGILLLVCGALTGYPELLGFGAACIAALIVGTATVLIRPEIEASRTVTPSRVTEGTSAYAVVAVTNTGRHTTLPLVVHEQAPKGGLDLRVPSLAPGSSVEVSSALNDLRRGVYLVGPSKIDRCDPLRLISVTQMRLDASTLHVHPRYCFLDCAQIERSPSAEGVVLQNAPREGAEFHSLRKYESGDDLRLVHWKASARAGTLMLRNNVLPQESSLIVALDTSDVYAGDSFEEAVRVAASLCISARADEIPVSLRTTRGDAPSGEGPRLGGSALLDYLAAVRASSSDRGLVALAGVVPKRSGGSLVVVTGQPGGRALATLEFLRRRYRSRVVVQVGEPATALPEMRGVSLFSVASLDDFQSAWNGGAVR
jgi:uncharacterized protein (DUF58 family)